MSKLRESEPFSVAARLRSFVFAFAGLATLLREQPNARLHLLATVAVVVLALVLDVSRTHWLVLLLTMALVWVAEALNSALEYLCDAAVPEPHELIGKAKDVAAAGVLIAAGFAVTIAALVFLPYL
ncbi:MAG: diacylglycerol kinase family protein [Gammaproteobacteria bacterium]|nr:diacylglycerol kinase family protein [Gammaproteobacteria bacterium]